MSTDGKVTRRQALAGTAAFAIPAIVPSGVIGKPGRPGANDRIVIANIGVGGMGSNHIPPDSAALCDVDDNRIAAAMKKVTQGTPAVYKDFRKLLERKDIDAVTNGTPDHWHAHIAVMACQAGKHVYSEKPTCRTIEEGRAMVNAARRYNRVVQIGAQGRSNANARLACQYVRNGMLGKVSEVEIIHPDNPVAREWYTPHAVPSTLDWEMWLGPARWRPYHPLYHPAQFRWFMDLGGGQIRDRGNHAINIAFWLMNMEGYRGKVTCEATGDPQTTGMFDTPRNMVIRWRFNDPDWTLIWRQVAEVPKSHAPWGATYRGDRDSLIVTQGDGACNTEQKAKDYVPPTGGEVYLHPSPPEMDATTRHRLNWTDCIRSGKRPATDIEIGYRTCSMCILGNMAYLLGRPITFDMGAERFENDAEADRMIGVPYRTGWGL
jgi:predicted dehydrogenase